MAESQATNEAMTSGASHSHPSPLAPRPSLAPQIDALLSSLRRRIHAYVWIQGLALAIAWLGAAFWITLALDWWIEPPVIARQIMLGAVGVVLLYLIYRFILRRAFVRLADTNLAVLLERRFCNFGDSLVTTVELADHPDHAAGFNPQMLAHTQSDALKHLPDVELGDVFRPGPLAGAIFGGAASIIAVAAFAILASAAFRIWIERFILSSDEPWPRRTHLAIEGFQNGRIKVAKGSDVEIIALADTGFEVPNTVQIRYRTEDGKSRENMSRLGVAEPTDKFQKYSFTFRGILSSRSFDLVGGDATLRDFQIDVVDVPTIEMTLHCKFPDYMRRDPRDLPVTGIMQIPQGTKVTVQAKANKELVEVPVSTLVGDKTQAGGRIHLVDARDRRHFTYEIPQLDDDQILFFTLVDMDGIRTKEPIRLSLNATPDEPPHVGLHLRAIGTSITPQARLPVEGEVTDDYGVAKIWFEYKLDQGDATQTLFRANPRSRPTIKCDRAADEALDFKEKSLRIGQQVSLAMMAEDNRNLKGGPNIASSERYQLTVVAPDQLMSMLEARELTLRLRLEQIVQDLTSTRDALAELDFTPPKPAPSNEKPAAPKPANEKRASTIRAAVDPFVAADGANGKSSANPSGAEPDDARKSNGASNDGLEPGESNTPGPKRGLKSAPVVIEQTLAYSERGASETTSLAGAFDDIREEMVNNRIDTPAIESRLKDGIADPLRHIAEVSFPELDRRLQKLQAALADPQAKARHAQALTQIDDILVEMQQVMKKMLELESFNQIVQDLRKIITEQEELNRLTQKLQKLKALSPND
jgi:hypothetical protein